MHSGIALSSPHGSTCYRSLFLSLGVLKAEVQLCDGLHSKHRRLGAALTGAFLSSTLHYTLGDAVTATIQLNTLLETKPGRLA